MTSNNQAQGQTRQPGKKPETSSQLNPRANEKKNPNENTGNKEKNPNEPEQSTGQK